MNKTENIFNPENCNSFKLLNLNNNERNLLQHYLNPANYYILFEDIADYDTKNNIDKIKDRYEFQNKKNIKNRLMEHNIKIMYGVSSAHSIIQSDDEIYLNAAHVYCLLEFLSILASHKLAKIIKIKERINMNKPEYKNEFNEDIQKLPSREKDINSLKYLDSKIRYFLDYGSLKIIEALYTDFTLKQANDFVSKRYKN